MTLMEHLIELRTRLIWVIGALLIGTLIAMVFVNPILRFITEPLTELGAETIAIGPTDTITIFFKVSITVGAVFAMPVIVYQFIAFVAPGLYPHEKRMLLLTLPGVMVLFLTGAAFAYFVLMPVAVGFLQGFLGDVIRQEWTIDRYIGFVTRVVFWIGVSFEMPLVLAFLARAGIVSGRQLLGFWRQAVVIIAVMAAAITPTVDPINMSIVMGPLLLLYLGSCGLAHLVYRPREPRDFSDGFFPDEEDDDAGEGDDDVDDGGDDDPPAGPSGSGAQVPPDEDDQTEDEPDADDSDLLEPDTEEPDAAEADTEEADTEEADTVEADTEEPLEAKPAVSASVPEPEVADEPDAAADVAADEAQPDDDVAGAVEGESVPAADPEPELVTEPSMPVAEGDPAAAETGPAAASPMDDSAAAVSNGAPAADRMDAAEAEAPPAAGAEQESAGDEEVGHDSDDAGETETAHTRDKE